MIVFDLACAHGHVFEAWFGSSADFEAQAARGLVACPICDNSAVRKAVMAPAVPAKGNRAMPPAAIKAALAALAQVQREVEANADYVGADFASEARALHDGEAPMRAIYGEASLADAAALVDDGIAVSPLPFATVRRKAS
ncbi:MAG: DUF1178 family protein [Polymorphobacter sp.]